MNRHEDDLDALKEISARLHAYLADVLAGHGTVRPEDDPYALKDMFEPFTGKNGQGAETSQNNLERASRLTDLILKHSTPALHPGFLNQLYGGFQPAGLAGEWVSSVLNMSMATFEISPVASVLESLLFARTRELVGFPAAPHFSQTGGTLVPGGSNGNMVALLVARNKLFPQTKSKGLMLSGEKPLCFFISEEAHYSFEKAANVLGLGSSQVIPVQADAAGRMDPAALSAAIEKSRRDGLCPFFVGATSGTTVKAAFDPLENLVEICRREKLWLHVDAALGGSLLFSKKHRSLLNGLENADSVVWDAHKLMNVPLVASILLFRDTTDLLRSNSGGGEQYLFHPDNDPSFDSGMASLQCGRRADVFKIFYAWFLTGEKRWEEQMDAHMARTQNFASRLQKDPRFEIVAPVQSVSLCFRLKPAEGFAERAYKYAKSQLEPRNLGSSQSSAETQPATVSTWRYGKKVWQTVLEQFQESGVLFDDQLVLREWVANEGRFMVNYSGDANGKAFFRLVALNNLVDDSVYEEFFNQLLSLAGYADRLAK